MSRSTAAAVTSALLLLALLGVGVTRWLGRPVPAPSLPRITSATAPLDALKITVTEPGLYRLDGATLAQAGLDPSRVAPEAWHLWEGDRAVPLARSGSGADLRLVWYAPPNDSLYSADRVYRLAADLDAASLTPAPLPAVTTGGESARAIIRQRVEAQKVYYPSAPAEGDRWYDRSLYGGDSAELTITLPTAPVGPVSLRVRLWAKSSDPAATPDHRLGLAVNGHEVGHATFDGHGFWLIEVESAAAHWQPGTNTITLRAPGDTGAVVEQNILDWIEIEAPVAPTLHEGRGEFFADGPLTLATSSPTELWEVSDPAAPRRLDAAPGSHTIALSAGSHLLAADEHGLRAPTALGPFLGADLASDSSGADYLVITPPAFRPALQPLLDARAAQGLRVRVAESPAIYDAFGAGERSPTAIQNFLRAARTHWAPPAPRFVLLVGDASYDPRGYLGATASEQIPTCFVETIYVGQTASDHCYADLDGDQAPELAVGRFPASEVAQVETLVAKTIAADHSAADGAAWRRRTLLIADREPEYSALSATLTATLAPRGYDVTTFSLADPAHAEAATARAQLQALLNDGVGLVNYAGHGSIKIWGKDAVFTTEDAPTLTNAGRLPIVTAMSCLTGFFQHPTVPSLAEALLWNPRGGAVAAFVPSSEGTTPEQTPVATTFYDHLSAGRETTLGEAIVAAKRELVAAGVTTSDMLLTFNLLGDPALRLAPPPNGTAAAP